MPTMPEDFQLQLYGALTIGANFCYFLKHGKWHPAFRVSLDICCGQNPYFEVHPSTANRWMLHRMLHPQPRKQQPVDLL